MEHGLSPADTLQKEAREGSLSALSETDVSHWGLYIQREIRPKKKKKSSSEVFSLHEKMMPGYEEKLWFPRCTLGFFFVFFFLRLFVEVCVSV